MNPRAERHLYAAARNQTIARRMLGHFDSGVSPAHDDRVMTVAFYSALHLVDAFLLDETGRTPENHRERNFAIRAHPFLSTISAEYNSLRIASERARYQPDKRFPPHAVQQAFDQLDVIQRATTHELNQS